MASCDRLATLLNRFSLRVQPIEEERANLVVTADDSGVPNAVLVHTRGGVIGPLYDEAVFSARFEWGGEANPLFSSLSDQVALMLEGDDETIGLVHLLQSELAASRCGCGPVVNRLGEVLLVRVLRAQIEKGSTRPGLLAGLHDARISRAIVAIHDDPGRDWYNSDLAHVAGLSLSRFSELFPVVVGQSPAAYLRTWRLTLARQDVVRGERVDRIARRYGYRSPEGFARAFKKQFGTSPIEERPRLSA
ncbi:MAG: AraC family transcriptional regulator [Pseudomonadota bacterium]